jgi:hypothetical protein
LATTGASAADKLLPGNGYSIHLPSFDGVAYYTVEQDGYKVVTTLASGADGVPLRLSSTLRPGQRIVISVPQSAYQPSVDIVILRDGDGILLSGSEASPVSDANVDLVGALPTPAAVSK